jgi:mono/diheme cytochrome c family protein
MKSFLKVVFLAILAASATAAVAQSAADNYKSKCAMCHGPDGAAATPAGKAMQTPPVTSPQFAKASDVELIAILKNGKAKMPAYNSKLTDDQMKALVTYMRSLK